MKPRSLVAALAVVGAGLIGCDAQEAKKPDVAIPTLTLPADSAKIHEAVAQVLDGGTDAGTHATDPQSDRYTRCMDWAAEQCHTKDIHDSCRTSSIQFCMSDAY